MRHRFTKSSFFTSVLFLRSAWSNNIYTYITLEIVVVISYNERMYNAIIQLRHESWRKDDVVLSSFFGLKCEIQLIRKTPLERQLNFSESKAEQLSFPWKKRKQSTWKKVKRSSIHLPQVVATITVLTNWGFEERICEGSTWGHDWTWYGFMVAFLLQNSCMYHTPVAKEYWEWSVV